MEAASREAASREAASTRPPPARAGGRLYPPLRVRRWCGAGKFRSHFGSSFLPASSFETPPSPEAVAMAVCFADKDKRRCEYEIWKFFELIKKNEYVASDPAAKEIWQNLCESHPECKIVDDIPINDLYNDESWHQKLIRKISLYNEHKKAAQIAENALDWTSKAAPVITAEMHEEAPVITAEMHEEAKAKKEKQEDAKGSEGDQ